MYDNPVVKYLEREVFFPILKVEEGTFRGQRRQLEQAQRGMIKMMRTVFYPMAGEGKTMDIFIACLSSPKVQTQWRMMRELGFATPLQEQVQLDLLKLVYEDKPTLPFEEEGWLEAA